MKYGTYGGYDFNRFFNQTKQEAVSYTHLKIKGIKCIKKLR